MVSVIGNDVQTTGQRFNNWTVKVAREETEEPFIVSNAEDTETYTGDFARFTQSYVKEYDTDGDHYISFEEFYSKEVQMAKDNGAMVPPKEIAKLMFDRLNINNTGKSQDTLSEQEMFNYLYTLDGLGELPNPDDLQNGKMKMDYDGKISSYAYVFGALLLTDPSRNTNSLGSKFTNILRTNHNTLFNTSF